MFFSKLFKCCFHGAAVESDVLPLVRVVSLDPMPKSVTSHLPTSPRPIPQMEVSVSSSTSLAMFEHESIISIGSPHNSFTSNDTFEDVDLSTPIKFSNPPKARKMVVSPFDDHHEVNNAENISGTLNNENKVSQASSNGSNTPLISPKQSISATSLDICTSPFEDNKRVESEAEPEYAPTTPCSGSDYTERAMEYQRGKSYPCALFGSPWIVMLTLASVSLLFGSDSFEFNNVHRNNTLAVLEGTVPHSTEPLE